MIFHSVIPYCCVFATKQSVDNAPKGRVMTEYSGVIMEVSMLENGKRRIERLYSTNPALYVDEQFCIGTIIDEEKSIKNISISDMTSCFCNKKEV